MKQSTPLESMSPDPDRATLVTDDLPNFWRAIGAAEGDGLANALAQEYFAPGTPGLKSFVERRIESAEALAQAVEAHRDYYLSLRPMCERVSATRDVIRKVYRNMAGLYGDCLFPDTYLLIGRLNCGGTVCEHGLLIGFEMFGEHNGLDEEAFRQARHHVPLGLNQLPLMIAHELAHFQQRIVREELRGQRNEADYSLLTCALSEGVAEFVGELISGGHVNGHIHAWALPRERELWRWFRQQMHGTDISQWLYNRRHVTDQPGDLGYFVGYRIAQAYYAQAQDKRQAVGELLEAEDFEAIIEASAYGRGW